MRGVRTFGAEGHCTEDNRNCRLWRVRHVEYLSLVCGESVVVLCGGVGLWLKARTPC